MSKMGQWKGGAGRRWRYRKIKESQRDNDEVGVENRAEQLRFGGYLTNVSEVVPCGLNTKHF